MSTSIWPRHREEAVQNRSESGRIALASLVILELFVGLGGIFGGLEMIRNPQNAFGMTTELIEGSPFDTYTWPGILLLVLVGLTPCVLAIGLIAGWPGVLQLSALFGVGLMAWIGVQWAMLSDRLWLQPLIFSIGAVITALSVQALRRTAR